MQHNSLKPYHTNPNNAKEIIARLQQKLARLRDTEAELARQMEPTHVDSNTLMGVAKSFSGKLSCLMQNGDTRWMSPPTSHPLCHTSLWGPSWKRLGYRPLSSGGSKVISTDTDSPVQGLLLPLATNSTGKAIVFLGCMFPRGAACKLV